MLLKTFRLNRESYFIYYQRRFALVNAYI
jgi:hypothetical protein